MMNNAAELLGGFVDPVRESQQVFRQVLNAMSRPGTIVELEAVETCEPFNYASHSLALALFDYETPIWLSNQKLADSGAWRSIQFHTGCPSTDVPENAAYALFSSALELSALDQFSIGVEEYPDRSATVVAQVERLECGSGLTLQGPGIKDSVLLDSELFGRDFEKQWNQNHALFPLGVDLILTCGNRLAALPRTVKLV